MALPTPILLLLLLFSPSSSTATDILLTGDVLPANSRLSTPNAAFINRTLALTDRGQLLILAPNGSSTIWSPSPPAKTGLYAALLRPDGHAAIYGPSLWSTPHRPSVGPADTAKSSPINARSHMFSSQVLNGNSMLASGDHKLVMKDDCSLELVKEEEEEVVWESGTKGRGRSCFARLDHRGQLAVVDDRFSVVWASKAGEADGLYVLVVQNDGRAGIYGPAIWSTAS